MNQSIYIELSKLEKYKTNHILHLLLSLITAGFWIPVWFLVALSNANERMKARGRIRKIERNGLK